MKMQQFRLALGVAVAATAVGVFGVPIASAEEHGGGGAIIGSGGDGFSGGGGGYVETSQADLQGTDYAHAVPDPVEIFPPA